MFKCKGGIEIVKVTKHTPIQYETHYMRGNLSMTLPRGWASQRPRIEYSMTDRIEKVNKVVPLDILLYSEMLPSPVVIREGSAGM